MAKQTVLKVSEGKTEEAIKGFLKSLLEKESSRPSLFPRGFLPEMGLLRP